MNGNLYLFVVPMTIPGSWTISSTLHLYEMLGATVKIINKNGRSNAVPSAVERLAFRTTILFFSQPPVQNSRSILAALSGSTLCSEQRSLNKPSLIIKLYSETQVSCRLGMSGGISPRHAQNALSGERRKTLSITHHALSPPPSHHHLYIIHLIN